MKFPQKMSALLFWEIFMSDANYYIDIWHLTWNFPIIMKSLLWSTKELPDVASTVFPDTNWGNFMSGAKSLSISDIKFPYIYKLIYSGLIGEISCKMPEAYFRHEISPLLQTNIYCFKWGNFMSDARSLFQTWIVPSSKN